MCSAPSLKRRHFLQFAGSSLAAMGLSQFDFLTQAEGYGQALGQSTPRKLAMLVGINDYPFAGGNLQGCLTDVELQYELLVNRFGFNPSDIVRVTSGGELSPTRDTILQVFKEHLIDQAQPGDVVVFHYSGHGSRVADRNPVEKSLIGTLVPMDATQDGNEVNHITSRTLFLLMKAIRTENLTMVLDSCYSGGGFRGNTIVREAPIRADLDGKNLLANDAEYAYQQDLMAELGISFEEFQRQRGQGIAKGIALGSASSSQLALDMAFNGFHAGAFTYLLTRYLWQLPGSTPASAVQANLVRSTAATARQERFAQVPQFEFAPDTDNDRKPLYFTSPVSSPAEAVLKTTLGDFSDGQVRFWLGGVSPQYLDAPDDKAVFTVLDNDTPVGEIIQSSRTGLLASGRPVTSVALKPGMLLREKIVGLPANPVLKIGVDRSLADEAEGAIAALNQALLSQTGKSRIQAQAVSDDSTTAFDFLLGRMTAADAQLLQRELGSTVEIPPVGTVALFSPSDLAPVAASYGPVNELATTAVARLRPRLKRLLAGIVLRSLASTASNLDVSGEIFSVNGSGPSLPIAARGVQQTTLATVQPFRANEELKIRMENRDYRQALFLSCIAIGSRGDMTVVYPVDWNAPDDAARIEPNSALEIPRPEDQVRFKTSGAGYVELLTLVSTRSLRGALRGLQSIARGRGQTRGYLSVDADESLDVVSELLGDINSMSRGGNQFAETLDSDTTAVDHGAIAVFSTVIEVTE